MRNMVYKNLWFQLRDRKMSSLAYFDMIVNHFGSEHVPVTIQTVLGIASTLLGSYIPPEKSEGKSEQVF